MVKNWIHGATIYQVYPRSFKDSSEKGIGDLQGILQKLDYIKSLNVDAIWLSPFFKSPMHDFGYDISDYRSVDPLFGTMEDFDLLVEGCKQHDLKVIIDLVLNHTSVEHEWFLQSRHSETNDKADWYVWKDAKPDGSAPNNWLSVFGGPAWTWCSRRGQYYFHNFLKTQPDLNLRNPEVQEAILKECHFWMDKGVDGFRLDACNFYFHDPEFRDNPPKSEELPQIKGVHRNNPYSRQWHIHNKTQEDNILFLKKLRQATDSHPNKPVLIAEILADNNQEVMAQYIEPAGPLHTAYSFEYLGDNFSAEILKKEITTYADEQWPASTFGNHDVPRLFDRWEHAYSNEDFVKQVYTFHACSKGAVFLYQGDELGLPQAEVPFEKLQDPYGIEFFPEFKGRDGCRTPMPWTESFPCADFTSGQESWLPIPNEHIMLAVNIQNFEQDSILNHVRKCFDLRQKCKTLKHGKMELFELDPDLLSFVRSSEEREYYCYFNFGSHPITVTPPLELKHILDLSRKYKRVETQLHLEPGASVVMMREI